jgi:zinc transporter 5/7
MHGIFLHIAADAGGSLAVILSTALALWRPWYLWDPLATIFIAVLIFAAAVPLVTSSARKLLLVLPEGGQVEWNVMEALREVVEIRGVVAVAPEGLRVWEGVKIDGDGEKGKQGGVGLGLGGGSGNDHHGHDHHLQPPPSHGHDHKHDHSPSHSHDHKHDHDHDHKHSHSHDHHHHDHSHHDHSHSHSHPHEKTPITLVGAIHILSHPGANMEDVRSRVAEFLRGRGMDLVVQVTPGLP